MNAGDAAVEVMSHVEQRRVGFGDLRRERQPFRRNRLPAPAQLANAIELFHSLASPGSPMAQQPTNDPYRGARHVVFGQQIDQNVVVVAGIESNLTSAAGFGHASQDIQSAVAMERSNLDRNHLVERRQAPPELDGQY